MGSEIMLYYGINQVKEDNYNNNNNNNNNNYSIEANPGKLDEDFLNKIYLWILRFIGKSEIRI